MVNRRYSKGERGAVLIVALIFMLVLSVVGVSAMSGSNLEERMAGNRWEQARAFQAAESALSDGTHWLLSQAVQVEANSSGSEGVYSPGEVGTALATRGYDWNSKGKSYGAATGASSAQMSELYKLPQYLLEETAFVPEGLDPDSAARGDGRFYYTIMARGYGVSDSARSSVETVIQKRYR